MILPTLSEEERGALETMAVQGPHRTMPVPVRGRLALYKLIDETPQGWAITALGRKALQEAPSATPSNLRNKRDLHRSSEAERHYGKKNRDTSWFG